MKNTRQNKLNAAEAVIKLIKFWKEAKSVIIFADRQYRVKATKVDKSDDIRINFGKPNYLEKILYKKNKISGQNYLTWIVPDKKSKKK